MRVLAFCAESMRAVTMQAAGVAPMTSPPLTADFVRPAMFRGYDLLYFKLHGVPGRPCWFGDHGIIAVRAEQIAEADLAGAVVFVAGCWLPETPMLEALQKAGPKAIIGGSGTNYAGGRKVDGADLLGFYFRRALSWLKSPALALAWAKARLRLAGPTLARQDALEFKMWRSKWP